MIFAGLELGALRLICRSNIIHREGHVLVDCELTRLRLALYNNN